MRNERHTKSRFSAAAGRDQNPASVLRHHFERPPLIIAQLTMKSYIDLRQSETVVYYLWRKPGAPYPHQQLFRIAARKDERIALLPRQGKFFLNTTQPFTQALTCRKFRVWQSQILHDCGYKPVRQAEYSQIVLNINYYHLRCTSLYIVLSSESLNLDLAANP
jgi:hypothetical protein